ncbi:MAG TPA: COQ9 family protein [Alphaproteobacteria bacterium]|jgi:ubiquinone biosynthesis protein COQ9|nr:COQ9 family protein [Alphaproteobacteria bacterium]
MTSPSSEQTPGGAGFDRLAVRRQIIAAALPHVPFDGWTAAVLAQSAVDAGHPATMALRVFPGGPIEAIEFWCAEADRAMVAALEARGPASMKVRERIGTAVRLRLDAVGPHREAIRRALGLLALPHNAPVAARSLWRTVDAVWYAAGDTATDYNWYTKRGLLAGVYGTTLMYWLDDKSEGFADTWTFLDRRIADVMRVPRALGDIAKRLGDLPNLFRPFRPRGL